MNQSPPKSESEFKSKLQWLLFVRLLFSSLLLGSTIILQFGENASSFAPPLLLLYGIIISIFILSFLYAIVLNHIKRYAVFAFLQVSADTFIVSLIIFVTGSFASVFSFLYLVVIIYSSMLLPRRVTIFVAALCGIQFGIMVDLEYYGFITPFSMPDGRLAATYAWNQVLYKITITMLACYAVAFLSGLLSEQTHKTKKELRAMEDQVKRVEKMAAVGEMAAGLAHEIKNPLASLSGSIQLLREDIHYDPDHDRLMQIILREADRLSSLVTNFLLYARPPAGKVEAIELDKALIETAELFEKDGSTDGRISTTKAIESGVWISMDSVHLRQVLWNLLLNAADAIQEEGNISIEMYPLKNKQACIKITDDGCGMSQEILSSIFDPFFTTKSNGTGLGLSIVHRILEAYDSHLDVESEINKGTTFTVKFKQIDSPT
jgi:two-component system sensor histidine kinase PilS (NtrC family)